MKIILGTVSSISINFGKKKKNGELHVHLYHGGETFLFPSVTGGKKNSVLNG